MSECLKISQNVTYESIDENIYILNLDDGEYYMLIKFCIRDMERDR